MVNLSKEPATKAQLVNNLDLLRIVVAGKVELDDNDYGLCPFHDERTKSFHLFKATSGRARFHCFGCGASGDIFNYLQLSDKLGFNQAINKLSNLLQREVSTEKSSPSLSSPRGPENIVDETGISRFCENDCQKYIDLRKDYNLLLLENEALRAATNIDRFRPINELSTSKDIAEWVVRTCEMFGTTIATAYRVAGLFVQGLNRDDKKTE